MLKQNIGFNQITKSLNRDQNNLGEVDYSHLFNGLFEGIDGGTFNLTNEMSNLLSSKFKEGFRVINATNDIYSNSTYFFLVNPINGIGEIGEIKNAQQVVNVEDTISDCTGCVKHLDLAAPLEGQVQTPLNTYTTLLTDACHILAETPEKGFQFNINYPIKKVVIKNEKCGKTIYFTDNNNSPRYIVLDKLAQYLYTGEIVCGVNNRVITCLDADKLLIFRRYTLPNLTPTSIQLGGILKLGVYEFLIAYCDALGNEISEYTSITNPVQIFDRNNVTLLPSELGNPTNFSIKLEVKDLDQRFTHYKIAVIQNALESIGATRYYIEGIHTINDNVVLYSGGNDARFEVTLSDLLRENIFVNKWELLTEVNNSLFGVGITTEKEINLQPIVNLLELKWQTHVAQEDLYKNGINVANYLSYQRDEVYPFSIRFLLKGGYKTALYPLINRNAKDSDLVVIPDTNLDKQSIESDKTRCIVSDRSKYWQYYNTATVDNDFCLAETIKFTEVDEEIIKICTIENIFTIPGNTYTLEINNDFTDLRTYIEDNKINCQPVPLEKCQNIIPTPLLPNTNSEFLFCNYLDPNCYTSINCSPRFNDQRINIINIGDKYIIYNIAIGDNFSNTGFTTTGVVFTAIAQPLIWINGTEVFKNSCTTPVKFGEDEIIVADIDYKLSIGNSLILGNDYIINNLAVGDNFTNVGFIKEKQYFTATETIPTTWITTELLVRDKKFIESTFPQQYSSTILKNTCRIYKAGDYNGIEVDPRANPYAIPAVDGKHLSWMPCGDLLVVRELQSTNTTNTSPDDIQNISSGSVNTYLQNYFNDYDISTDINNLRDIRVANPIASGWSSTLHKKALWFKTNIKKDRFVFEVTPQKLAIIRDGASDGELVRVSLYKSNKGSLPPFYTTLVDLSQGAKFLFEKAPTGFNITNEAGGIFLTTDIATSRFYVAVDCKIVSQRQSTRITYRLEAPFNRDVTECFNADFDENPSIAYRIAPTNGCYTILTRDIEYSKVEVNFTGIKLNKKQTYTSICTFQKPILDSCKATPNKKGSFAYNQSNEKYPDNESLYNSSLLKVKPLQIPLSSRINFENNFVIQEGLIVKKPILDINGNYQWRLDNLGKPLSNYTCRAIQHFKMPDNKVSAFMYENQQLSQSNSIIYPLGVTIDENTINTYLDLAVNNNLITKEKRNEITGYEIFRGDIDQDRSVKSSGFLFNMRTYEQDGKTFQYSNYPYNDLGVDKMNLDSRDISYNKFTFHSPETDYYKPTLASELSIQGYQFGQTTNNYFEEVKDHPKYVILTDQARRTARRLALLEASTEIAVIAAQSAESFRVAFGTSNSINVVGAIASTLAASLSAVSVLIVNYGRYRLQWLKTFRDLGEPQNFAYYNHSSAKYNYLQTLQLPQQQLRGIHQAKYLKPKDTVVVDDVTGLKVNINNLDREKSVFLSLGENHSILYPTQYSTFDNNISDNNTGSLGFAKEVNACVSGRSKVTNKNVASPYVALKNYLPNQHGTINSINWVSTGYKGDLTKPLSSCTPIFGGDTFISRHEVKRKIPLFTTDNFGGGDLEPFAYKQYCNIGRNPRFYIDYEVAGDFDTGQGLIIPDISYDFSLDCENRSGNYFKSPSKFYLYYYGFPSFLTETRINTWNRTAEKELKNNFFPNTGDTAELTQQKNVRITEEEKFLYNQIYSKGVTNIVRRTLYDTFSQLDSDCKNDKPNGFMWSNPDNSENKFNDDYLIYNPLNFYEVTSKYGRVKDVRNIEREQILIRQEHATSLFNALDLAVDDGRKPETRNLASAFARRPMTYTETDLGYGGTQSTQSVSCEFGHFHVDAKRGQVIQIKTGGQGVEDIASTIGGQPSGMRNWFKEHLPFKVLKSKIAGIENIDLDNGINGFGIVMGYDARFRRIFITKKDYIPKENSCLKYDDKLGFYNNCLNTCPSGYTYNITTDKCEQIVPAICCTAGIVAPNILESTIVNTCPTITFDLSTLTNTHTAPIGTTLIWSLTPTPNSVSQHLTNITTISVAGTYYAMYYDQIYNCYSPSDSIVATIDNCCLANFVITVDYLDEGCSTEHACNAANFYVLANNIKIGLATLSNTGQPIIGDTGDFGNRPIGDPVDSSRRTNSFTLTTQQAIAISNASLDGNIVFKLNCATPKNVDFSYGLGGCHTTASHMVITRNGIEIYNNCLNLNTLTINPCTGVITP